MSALIGSVLLIVDAVFIAIGKRAGSQHSGGPVLVWILIQVVLVLLAGVVQGVRRRPWVEVVLLAAVAAAVLALSALVSTNPAPRTDACPGSQSCDTAFGLGAILIAWLAFVALGAAGAAGRVLGGAVAARLVNGPREV